LETTPQYHLKYFTSFNMAKVIFSILAHTALASEEDFADDGLSLLQTRVHKHENDDVEYEGDDADYFAMPKGSLCKPEEVLSLAQCLEVQEKRSVAHTVAVWSTMGSVRSTTTWKLPSGCMWATGGGGQLYWNDEPAGTGNSAFQPVCAKNGNGGRAAEIASQGMSCQEPTCVQPAGPHNLAWTDDGVAVPEVQILPAGSVCEPCGILSYAQCAKAGDMGILEAINGVKQKHQPMFQCNGGGHSRPAVPSGCWIGAQFAVTPITAFCPYDTPDGATSYGVSDSGVGVGWGRASPVCGVCTTTTTTTTTEAAAVESIIDEAAGECPDNQMVAYVEGRADNAEYRRDAQRQMVKFDTEDEAQGVCNVEDDCVGIWSDGRSWLGLYPGGRSWAKGVPNGSVKSVKLKSCVDMPVEEDEAAAVGDPHFVTNTGNRFDYS